MKHIYRHSRCIVGTLLLLVSLAVHAQEKRVEIDVEFRVNKTIIEPRFGDNASHLRNIIATLEELQKDTTIQIVEVSFRGSASPEGPSRLNRRLAHGRMEALERYVRNRIDIPDSIITRHDSYIPWRQFRQLVADMELEYKDEVLDIIDLPAEYVSYRGNDRIDHRVVKLMELHDGAIWDKLLHDVFHDMRSAFAIFVTVKQVPPPVTAAPALAVEAPGPELDSIPPYPITPWKADEKHRHLHLSTNLLGWGLLVSNGTVELDLGRHWSVALPVYYSALNYFTDDVKFRTFTVYPELRYWFRDCESSFFVGAHYGMSYFNVAFGDMFRYQDHYMKTPATGLGLSLGYRMPLGDSRRWRLDLALGAGIYYVHYDRFVNIPNGFLVDSQKMIYRGIDQASVSLSYMLDIAKYKKRK